MFENVGFNIIFWLPEKNLLLLFLFYFECIFGGNGGQKPSYHNISRAWPGLKRMTVWSHEAT